MKRIILISICIVLVINGTTAQNKFFKSSTPDERAKIHTEWMQQNLSLTNEQLSKITPINLKYAKEMENLKSGDFSKIEKWKKIKEIDKRRIEDFKFILNSLQLKTYNDKKNELWKRMR